MPIYQYNCADCARRVDVFFRSVSRVGEPVCPECGGSGLTRVMSGFARARSDAERVDSIDFDREMGRMESGDVGGFARWARRMGQEYDGALASDFSDMADRADAGDDPIERVDVAHTLRHRIDKARDAASDSAGTTGGDAGV